MEKTLASIILGKSSKDKAIARQAIQFSIQLPSQRKPSKVPLSNAERQSVFKDRKLVAKHEPNFKHFPSINSGLYEKIVIDTSTGVVTYDLDTREFLYFLKIYVNSTRK